MLSYCFSISVINESLFQQEMRFSFPLLVFVHLSPLSSSAFHFASSPFPLIFFSPCFASSLLQVWVSFLFISLFFCLHSRRSSPPRLSLPIHTSPHTSGLQLIYYLLKMSSAIKIHDCTTLPPPPFTLLLLFLQTEGWR